jgi:PAS domain S-box-containing protein
MESTAHHPFDLTRAELALPGLLDALGIGIVVVDRSGRIARANEAFCRFLGYAERELVGLHRNALTHPDDIEATAAAYELIWSGRRRLARVEKRCLRRDGSVSWGRLAIAAVPSTSPTPRFAVVTCEDVTKQRDLEQKLHNVAALLGRTVLRDPPGDERLLRKLAPLSQREAAVVRLLAANQRVPSIAQSLGVDPRTVRNHLVSAYRKLGVHSQASLIDFLLHDEVPAGA